jgi:hypothetical protein
MQVIKRTLLFFLIIGFSGIQFVSLIDDVHHLTEPDPDCFFCMVSQTSVCINHSINIDFTPNIITYLIEYSYLEPYSHNNSGNISTRAPPFFIAS